MLRVCLPASKPGQVTEKDGGIQPREIRPLRRHAARGCVRFGGSTGGTGFWGQDAAPTTRSRRPWSDSVESHRAVSGVGSAAQPTTGFLVRTPWVGRKMGKKVPKIVHQPKTVLEGPSPHPFGPRGANGRGWVGSGIPRPAPPCLRGIWSARVEQEGQEERKERVVKQGDSSHAGGSWPASCCHLAVPVCPSGGGKGEIAQLLNSAPIEETCHLRAIRHTAGGQWP